MTLLTQACSDILYKNMSYTDESVYFLYDTQSPLAGLLSDAWRSVLGSIDSRDIAIREFLNPPQPLYRGWLINPDNPHAKDQNRIITAHNLEENKKTGLDHHETVENVITQEADPQIESILSELMALPAGSIVILCQSTNFRLSTFRIRLELFHRWVHVVEFNHLAYIPESQYETFFDSLVYRTPHYKDLERSFANILHSAQETRIQTVNGHSLVFAQVEKIRGNTGDYIDVVNKWGTFPLWEVFTESVDLDSLSGSCMIDTFPNEDFSVAIVEPFLLTIKEWRVLPSPHFPPAFQKLYDYMIQFEGEVRVRELGFGMNPALSTSTPLSDINFHERKLGVHLSLGKKHGIYGKKLPKTELQRFHIDVFLALEDVRIDGVSIYDQEKNEWRF